VIQKLGQHRAVEVPQKGLKKCLDYREPPRVCRGNPRTWFQKFYQNRGGILVLAGTNVRLSDFQCSRFVAVVFRHGVFLSKERPAVGAWDCLIFGRLGFTVKFLLQSQKNVMQKQKTRYNDS
jgi:hypothetical protein